MIRELDLLVIAGAVRSFLAPVWLEWHRAWGRMPDVPSRWTCGRSSLFLQYVLSRDCGVAAEWVTGVPRHGPEEPEIGPFGFFTGRRWEAHAWVEVESRWVVDITADQFLGPAIIVAQTGDARYGKGRGDTALPAFRDARTVAAERLWPLWQASPDRQKIAGSAAGMIGTSAANDMVGPTISFPQPEKNRGGVSQVAAVVRP